MATLTSATELHSRALVVREAFLQTGFTGGHADVRRELVSWLEQNTDDVVQLAYVPGLYDVTVFAPFASEVYNQAHQELLDALEEVERNA